MRSMPAKLCAFADKKEEKNIVSFDYINLTAYMANLQLTAVPLPAYFA
jgi:hypothetical protein